MTHDPLHDKHVPREPLTPEEQALARRIAQLGPQGEPASTLDARILAAARASNAAPTARATPRWPIAFGIAASLVLAIGIAWRLRPLPGPQEAARTPPAPVATSAPPTSEAATPAPTSAKVLAPSTPQALSAPSPSAPSRPSPEFRERARSAEPAQETGIAAPEPPIVLSAPAPAAMAALPAPPPPAPAAQAEASASPARKAAAEDSTSQDAFDAAAAADRAAGDEPDAEVPPATADSPDVREAWLQRIRELAAEGQTDAARASLKEFVHRHPDVPLPDDLRALSR